MDMSKAEEAKKLLSIIHDLECFRGEMYTNISDLALDYDDVYEKDYFDDKCKLGASVDIVKELGEVNAVKYNSYHLAITQVDNKIKELEERVASL